MASSVKIEFNSAGFREILMSDGVHQQNMAAAEKISASADCDTNVFSKRGNYGGGRMIAFVETATAEAAREEAEHGALSGAVHG